MAGKTNQPKASSDQATKRIPGPISPRNGNATKSGGINRATQGKA